MTKLVWMRKAPSSSNNFDLVLANPQEVDSQKMEQLLSEILKEKHRVFLTGRACEEFRRWFGEPDSPLKSEAYVLLSNWFMTRSGDRHSMLASRCEDLWDAMFPCRPLARLSSSRPGRNHLAIPSEFERFWQRVLETQREDGEGPRGTREADSVFAETKRQAGSPVGSPRERTQKDGGRHYDVVIERDGEGFFVGSVPQLPGCHTQARSLDELMQRMQEAIGLYVEVEGEPPRTLEFIGIQRVIVAA
jgi:predicted RNase H-like HicB family nuclease